MVEILDNLVVAYPCTPEQKCTYTFTLASWTGQILEEVEERYGQRDRSFTLLGIEFCDQNPQIWFPGNCGNIIIQLSLSVINHKVAALHELAHECVHLLDPVPLGGASVFEEGVGTLFAIEYAQRFDQSYYPTVSNYTAAAELVKEALDICPNVIRSIREAGTRFTDITPQQLRSECSDFPQRICDILCKRYATWDGSV
ncbi:MAG: hypothetical protein V1792_29355 [Pseudomonadota bacterium]